LPAVRTPIVAAAGAALVVPALSLGLAAPASAATTFGSGCEANNSSTTATVVLAAGAGGSAVASPVSGVVTRAAFNVPSSAPEAFPSKVKVVQPTGGAGFSVVAQSDVLPVPNRPATFPVRLPIAAGQLIGLSGTGNYGTLICTGSAGAKVYVAPGDVAPGGTAAWSEATDIAIPLSVTVEPDVDGDGFGDETQDLCPQSKAFQTPCPVLRLDSVATAKGKKVGVLVTASADTTASVSGAVKVGKKRLVLNGGSQAVTPGSLTSFVLKLPAAAKKVLADGKSLKVTVTTISTDALGKVITDTTTAKVTGHR
jgi:hypothetical protein